MLIDPQTSCIFVVSARTDLTEVTELVYLQMNSPLLVSCGKTFLNKDIAPTQKPDVFILYYSKCKHFFSLKKQHR